MKKNISLEAKVELGREDVQELDYDRILVQNEVWLHGKEQQSKMVTQCLALLDIAMQNRWKRTETDEEKQKRRTRSIKN